MRENQRTIESEVTFSGVGLHTGGAVDMCFRPAPPNTGIKFHRTDLGVEIVADIANAPDLEGSIRRTILGSGEERVSTVEHVLAAAVGLGIDNMVIDLNAEEPAEPDGSALPYVELLRTAGLVEQSEKRFFLEIRKPISLQENGIELIALPHDGFRISYTLQYDDPAIGTQHMVIDVDEETFIDQIAPARTFALGSEVAALKEMGLIKGGSYDNAIVVTEGTTKSNEPLRFDNEFVRHKILDLVGDLFLTGLPIKGHIIAHKSGHSTNVKLARLLRSYAETKYGPTLKLRHETPMQTQFDIHEIMKILPHRYPFLLLDKIIDLGPKHVTGIKNVTMNEPFFMGHFPGHPIMPAVLILEAMAQAGGILLLNSGGNPAEKLVYFMGINNAKFRKPVLPGDTLRFELKLIRLKTRICKMRGEAYVGDDLVAEADLLSTIVDR